MHPAAPMPLPQLGVFLEDHLLQEVMPFWLKHAIDPQGGINTCINDDGSLVSHDKIMWSQCRAIYTFSALYNRIEPRQQWLDIAAQIFEFCSRHGRDEQGRWIFKVDRAGRPLEGPTSIYVDGFFLQGAAEYLRATGDARARTLALETFDNVHRRLAQPGSYESFPYPIPAGLKAHGISMIFSSAFFELGRALGDQRILTEALRRADEVMDDFRQPRKQALLEFVHLDGSPQDSPIGRAVVPGHAIESMWFQIHQYQHLGRQDRIGQCLECIRWHLERGWDREFGGILLGLDLEDKQPVYWKFPDTKLWWPITEAMYALLLSHHLCGEPWCLDWYWKVHQVAFKHYPVPVHGEWTQKFDRRFRKITDVVALPVKDPFHLPRSLILCTELLRQYR